MKTSKIFVDCHVFDHGFQGTTTYLRGLYLELIKYNHLHFYFAAEDTKNLEKIFGTANNITYLKYKYKSKFYRLLFDIPRLIKKNGIDFAHFQYIVSPFKKCKYIVTTHDVLFIDFPEYFPKLNRIKNTFLYKWSLKRADIALTVSNYSKSKIKEHFQIDDAKVTTNAVEEVFFESFNEEETRQQIHDQFNIKKYIVYVSRWEPRKKHDLVLKGFANLKLYENYSLLFIGDVSIANPIYDNYFEGLSAEIKSKVVTLRKVPFLDMVNLVRNASVSVYPSVAEGFGIPPLESLAAGVPTITSNKTAMSDFEFLNDYMFNPDNQSEFEEKLLKVINEGVPEIEKLGDQLKEKYSWKKSAQVYLNAINEKSPE